jgi:hypothetical protein
MNSKSLCKKNALRLSLMEVSFSFIVTALFIASLSAISAAASPVSRVDIIVPASALLNDNVLIRIVDDNNNAVAGAKVLIVSPSKESIVVLADSKGEAEFNVTYEGVYTYDVPDYYLTAIRTTNVIKPAKQVTTLTPPAQQPAGQQAPPSIAMALAAYSPWILGLLLLFIIVFFLATRRKKKSSKKR